MDQPKLTAGRWVRPGQVVIERTFAEALGVGAGDRVTLDGRAFTVGGIAVTAAAPPYPNLCYLSGGGCMGDTLAGGLPISPGDLGVIWVTEPDAFGLATPADPVSAPSLTLSIAAEVVAVAVAAALAATLVPAIRAARTSTISALAGAARTPRRRRGLIAVSRHPPVPLLIGLRLVARRTRRALLGAASVTVTTAGIVAALAFHVTASRKLGSVTSGLSNPVIDRDEQVLLVLTVVLVTLTVLNAICAAWTTVLDTRAASALTRALGATPRQVSAGIAAAQMIPAVPGALLGVPLGIGLYAAAGHSGRTMLPPAWWLAVTVLGTVLAVTALASVPALAGTRRPAAEILQAETA